MRVDRGACEAGGAWKCRQVHNLGNLLRVASIQTHRVWLCLENTGLANRVDKGPKAPPPPSPNIGSWRYNDKQQDLDA